MVFSAQDAERQIPITYASRYQAGALQRQAYLPFKVRRRLPRRRCVVLERGGRAGR